MFMSSSMRWRSGLMGFSLIGGSCLEVGVLDPSILKTERPPVTCARSNVYCGRSMRPTAPQRPPAGAGSFFDPERTSGLEIGFSQILAGHSFANEQPAKAKKPRKVAAGQEMLLPISGK
jgi:hypothetical protein